MASEGSGVVSHGGGNSKVLLMGRAGAGKTSMRSIVFANYLARETCRLHPTQQVEHSQLRFLGRLALSLWDCGGQDAFMENYFESQRNHIFSNVAVLIYVLGVQGGRDGENTREVQKDMSYFKSTCDSIKQLSPDAVVFVFVHKLDLIRSDKREQALKDYEAKIHENCAGLKPRIFGTTIWDETLFKAWSTMVSLLVPNLEILRRQMENIVNVCEADEVVLYELSTFLVITHATRKDFADAHRFEKISNIVKQFKLSCGKCHSNFKSLTVNNEYFTAFLTMFTNNTFIMVVTSDKNIHPAATYANLQNCRARFLELAKGPLFDGLL